MRMHDDEADIDAALVRELVAAQFPRLAGLPVTPFRSTGTVNAIYRLGSRLYVRLPRVARWAADLEAESRWLPWLAPHLTLRVPEPVAMGRPAGRYRRSTGGSKASRTRAGWPSTNARPPATWPVS